MLFKWVVCCSGGLYAVQEGNMDVQQGSMLKKITMFLVATNILASRPPKRQLTGTTRANKQCQRKLLGCKPC